jgi:hypothetical protein
MLAFQSATAGDPASARHHRPRKVGESTYREAPVVLPHSLAAADPRGASAHRRPRPHRPSPVWIGREGRKKKVHFAHTPCPFAFSRPNPLSYSLSLSPFFYLAPTL